jgi:phage shock protein A
MHRALEAILGSPRRAWEALRAEASALIAFLADVRQYSGKRWRTRKRGIVSDPHAFEKALNQIIIDSANALIEAKKNVAVAIAEEKHLARQFEQEEANRDEWTHRAERAEKKGDSALAVEARARAEEHGLLAITFKAHRAHQAAAVAALKATLQRLNAEIEQAKINRKRIVATYVMASRDEHLDETRRAMVERIQILDRLSAMAPQRHDEAAEDDDLEDDDPDDDPGPPLH